MILNKISDKNNSKLIAEKYLEWINSGASPAEILVLTFNSDSKKNVIKNILNLTKNNIISEQKIYTFNGLIYNTVLENWAMLENKISNKNVSITPNLTGMEISQYFLKQIIKDVEVKGYNSKKSLLHQIFRRYSLIVNNNLSDEDITKKSITLNESFANDAEEIIQKFKAKTIETRAFDYIRQAQIFSHIFKTTDYFNTIKYLIVEDLDELTPLCIDFIKSISSHLSDKFIIGDKDGGSRIGYLCADINAFDKLERIFNETAVDKTVKNNNVENLKNNILNGEKNVIENLSVHSLSKRADMIDYAITSISELINNGVKPSDISVISPVQDKMLKYTLTKGLEKISTPLFLSGNEKLIDNPLVKAILTILKLSKDLPVDEYELRVILVKYLGIPIKNCREILEQYSKNNLSEQLELGYYNDSFNLFRALLKKLKESDMTLSEKAYFTYINLIKTVSKQDITKFNFFLKELQDFEKVFADNIEQKDVITQIENSIISENPYSTLDIKPENIIISTPQKIIDNKIKTKYQFWLDISSMEWIKADVGPLYNSWVFQKGWNKSDYVIEDNVQLSREKTFKILRKLILNTEKIIGISSLFDTQGVENYGGIDAFLISEKSLEDKGSVSGFKIIPRSDQRPVLEYQSGQMAISAVPGAGKTTILLALIVELMNKGVNPENMYVLTYMESAARNFKDRIKSINPDSAKLPNISTIHGLALRILKENSNFERIGLNEDFEICDDIQRGNIIKSISEGINKTDLEDFDRAISTLKLSNINPQKNSKIRYLFGIKKGTAEEIKLSKFLKFFYKYQSKLAQNNLIDYDDILTSSVRLLEENKDILEYYQNICRYIIEDEAQDSSEIQQRLINLLSAKYKNLIRCGDINQAITTTFTNADVEGFKNFIKSSQRVDMNCSQRCTEGVWKLANRLVKYGNSKSKSPFYEIYMQPVEGKNPVEKKPINVNIFDNIQEEKIEITKTIKGLLSRNPESTIGILLRNNYQVNHWADYINNAGLSAITRNECLGQKSIFKVIFSVLKFVSEPFNNYITAQAYRALAECGFFKLHLDRVIENYTTDFIAQNNDDISDMNLSRFHWDMNYWLSFPELTIDELAMLIGLHYFSDKPEKSNIFLIATLCAKLNTTTFNQTVQKLEDLSKRPTLSGFKFFSEDEDENLTKGKIQIMTMHKSKGDEFDYVFIPELTEKNLTLDTAQMQLKKSTTFTENVKGLAPDYTPKSQEELKEFLINENYRLLYVAITRAKRRLYISTAQTEMYRGKNKTVTPSIIFDELVSDCSVV